MAKVDDISTLVLKKKQANCVSPGSWYIQLWEGLIALTCLLTTILVTFQIAFQASQNGLMLMLHTFDALFVLNIILKFNIGYIDKGTVVLNKEKIKDRYFKNRFIIDVISCFLLPLDYIEYFDAAAEDFKKVARALKVLKILRLYSLTSYFGHYEDQLGFNTKALRSFKYFLIAYTLIHSLSCGWFMLACPNEADVKGSFKCYSDGWAVVKKQNLENLSTLQRYIKCLYWATITATSTGYGDIHAVNPSEKWYSVITMLVGIGFFFGPILGYMASTLTNSESKRAKYTHRMGVISEHLNDKSVSSWTQNKVKGYYEYLWTRHQGDVKSGLFTDLPLSFQAEIALAQNKHVLEKAPLFRNIPLECLRMITVAIQPISYLPKQFIFSKDDIKHTLFYIKKGSVEVLDENDEKPIKLLREGSFFGEVSLLLNIPRCATVRALSYCELLALERCDLTKIMKHFPEVSEQLLQTIQRRCEEAATHIDNKKKGIIKNYGPDRKRFTIDKAVIILADFMDENEGTTATSCSRAANGHLLFHPKDPFLKRWKIVMTVSAVCFCFFHTYVMAYKTSFGRTGYGTNNTLKAMFALLYLMDMMYLIDIYIQIRTAIIDDSAGLCSDSMTLLKRYFKTYNVILDVLTVFPLEILALTAAGNTDKCWILVTFLRANRLVKIYKLFELLQDFLADIHFNVVIVHIIKLAFMILFITHTCGCVWFIQACFGDTCDPDSWADAAGITADTSMFDAYTRSIYWAAATMTSTGYGDITAGTSRGEFIVLFVLIIGLLMYGYCLSSIAAILTNSLSAKIEFTGRIIGVTSFMSEQNLNQALIERVERYLGLVWRIHKGQAIPGAELLMGDLPMRLQEEVAYEEMHKIIMKVPIFMNTDDSFMRQLTAKLITYVFMPGDTIVYSGDVGREMYIMRRGLVEVLSKEQNVMATLGPGGYFGEVGLIFGEPRTADVRAKTFCELAMLRKSDLDEVLVNFPLIEKQLEATGSNENVLRKIKEVAKQAGGTRKANRIDIIDKTRKLRSNSTFRRQSIIKELTEEETNVNEQLNKEFSEPYAGLHPILRFSSYFLMRNTINPNSMFFTTWTAVTVAVSCVYFCTLGFNIAFLKDNQILQILNYSFDFFFIVDIYIKMHVCFYNSDGVLVTHPTTTAKNYFRRSFILDFIAVLPIDAFLLNSSNGVYALGKLNRILHLIPVSQYFQYLDTPIQSGNSSIVRGIKFGTYMYLLTHLFACFWFLIGCPNNSSQINMKQQPTSRYDSHGKLHYRSLEYDVNKTYECIINSWAMQEGRDLGGESVYVQYITTMYWAAATTCSVGYGDIHPYVTDEMLLALVCMIVGVVFYGYIIASAAASLANADVQRARYQQKLDTINRFLKEQHIRADLEKRVKGFYEFMWNRNKGVDLENLFLGLPISLQADITLSLYKDIIESVPLFQGTELGFTKMLSLYIQPLLVPKGEYIVRKGDIGEEMFFINKGVVEVVSEHKVPIIFDTMTPGRFFGEISTIFKCPRTASIRTQTNVEMFVLKKKHLDVVLSHYPQIKKKIIETAEERQRMVAERAAAFAKKKKEEEDAKKRKEEEDRLKGNSNNGGNRDENSSLLNESECTEFGGIESEVVAVPSLKTQLSYWIYGKTAMLRDELKFVLPINSRWQILFNFNIFAIFITFITTTYMATFQHHPEALIVFNIFAEFGFYFEMYLNFHMSYLTKTGDVESDYNQIFEHYFKGKFCFDAIANFPLQLFCFVSTSDKMRYYSYLNVVHLIRIKRLRDWFSKYLKKLNINVLLIRLTENLIQITLALQTFACIWYITACPNNQCRPGTWATKRQDNSDPEYLWLPEENYGDCVYWALATMTSAGYGDIHANNLTEKVIATVVMIFGKLLFGFVLGNVASTMANAELLRVLFEERFAAIQTYMKEQTMPLDIQSRVVNFYQYIWRRNRGSSNDSIFNDLPPCLNAELCFELTGEFIKSVPCFKDCELPFIRLLSTKTKLIQFHQDEFITRKGDIGSEMYFIRSGVVDVVAEYDEVIQTLKEGSYFGEESLLGNCTRKQCTRAVTHVDLFCLRGDDLKLAFQSFPEEEDVVLNNFE